MFKLSLSLFCLLFVGSIFAVEMAAAQSTPGHVVTIRSHTVHPGQGAAYAEVYRDVVRPVFDKMKEDGDIVSYMDLVEVVGDREGTHLLIVEYPNYAAMDDAPAKMEAASQAVLGTAFQEALGNLEELRAWVGTEMFESTQ